jgi:hypothetical protein
MAGDRVHTVNDYFHKGAPRHRRVNGAPHIYEAEFDHSSAEYGHSYFALPGQSRVAGFRNWPNREIITARIDVCYLR